MTTEDAAIGTTVANYEIVECLGRGGMGAVYLAEHVTIQSLVAIKVLRGDHVSDPSVVKRFLDEARAVNRVGHPGIVQIHDCGTQEDLGAYLIMEYLQGTTLLQLFNDEGPLTPELTVRILGQAAAALAAAHEAGIIHRDIKPSNVHLIANADIIGGWQVKLLDFGVAKLVEDDPLSADTRTGTVLGSPQFMSPEQCLDSKKVDGRTDIFALGVIGYLMLTGKLPFPGESLGKVITAHLDTTPEPVRQLRPEVPEALERALARALARDREDRFDTVAAFGEAVRAVVLPPAVVAAPPSAPPVAARPAKSSADTLDPGTEIHRGSMEELLGTSPGAATEEQQGADEEPFVDDAPTDVDPPGEGPGGGLDRRETAILEEEQASDPDAPTLISPDDQSAPAMTEAETLILRDEDAEAPKLAEAETQILRDEEERGDALAMADQDTVILDDQEPEPGELSGSAEPLTAQVRPEEVQSGRPLWQVLVVLAALALAGVMAYHLLG